MPAPISSIAAIAASPEFSIAGIGGATAPANAPAPVGGESGGGFGSALLDQLDKLEATQQSASAQSEALATGQAEDVTSVVLEVERAQLALQLASQLRNKGVEAYHEIFRMQV
jgi:flagellar hook-basal body complex protein FliE